jgi:hypothetical protein
MPRCRPNGPEVPADVTYRIETTRARTATTSRCTCSAPPGPASRCLAATCGPTICSRWPSAVPHRARCTGTGRPATAARHAVAPGCPRWRGACSAWALSETLAANVAHGLGYGFTSGPFPQVVAGVVARVPLTISRKQSLLDTSSPLRPPYATPVALLFRWRSGQRRCRQNRTVALGRQATSTLRRHR